MWEKNLTRRMLLIAAAIVFAISSLYWNWPPKGGIDIEGGVSMIFEIDDSGLSQRQKSNLAETMKTLLQKRVDPKGVYQLTWRVHGTNRIEIEMPLPPPGLKKLLEDYTDALAALFERNLKRSDLDAIFFADADARPAEIRRLAAGVAKRVSLIQQAADRYDALAAANDALSRGPLRSPTTSSQPTTTQASQPATAPTQQDLEFAVRDADEFLLDAVDAVLATNINPQSFRTILALDDRKSLRPTRLSAVKAEHPAMSTAIDDVVKKHDEWFANRGYLDGPSDLRRLLRGAGILDFRILAEPDPANPTKFAAARAQLKESGPRRRPNDTEGWFLIDNPSAFFNLDSPADLANFDPLNVGSMIAARRGEEYYVLSKLGERDGLLTRGTASWKLRGASQSRDEMGRPCVIFNFNASGGTKFRKLTAENIGNQLVIMLDDVAYSAANIQEAIGASGRITGEFNQDKVQYLVKTMQGGALPARLKDTPLSERTIEARLGKANLDRAFKAGVIGVILVGVFMVVYYSVGGFIANVALVLNILFVLAIMAMLGARFTLDGIAGMILTIGMSVDANVLIFERMREEKERGSSLRMIVKNGYDKAFSTIVDANITTLLTCLILYYLGSEEVKGFGLTLGWGIVTSMFTALFVTRTIFTALVKYNVIKDIKMMKIIGVPKIDWYAKRKFFIPFSIMLVLAGVVSVFVRSPRDMFDVEFLGGISATLETTKPMAPGEIQERLTRVGNQIGEDIEKLDGVRVEAVPGDPSRFFVSLEGVEPDRLAALLAEPLDDIIQRDGVDATIGNGRISIAVKEKVSNDPDAEPQMVSLEELTGRIKALKNELRLSGDNLVNAKVNAVIETSVAGDTEDLTDRVWTVVTTETNKRLVQDALVQALGSDLNIQPRVSYQLRGDPYPITQRRLEKVIPDLPPGSGGDVTDFLGGVAYYFEGFFPPQSISSFEKRLRNMRFQPGYETLPWRQFRVVGVTPAPGGGGSDDETEYSSVVAIVADPDYPYAADEASWRTELAEAELGLARAALDTEQSLQKVTQFKPQIARQAQTRGIMALVFSWLAIIGYVWVRFGTAMYGLAGVCALIHDVLIALAFVAFSGLIGGAGHFGSMFLIDDFKIDMTILAAFLTIIGFSINDTIVIFDRIRETRGRLGRVTPEVINRSINLCMSRTILTSLTTFFVLLVMYIFGGSTIRGFNYCMMIGVLTGTYSSIAIAAPMLMLSKKAKPATA